nr:hypothetical protein [uncultured Campylobacter sp.]
MRYGVASATQKTQRRTNEAIRARDKKYRGAASVPSGADETSGRSEAIF